MVVPSTGAYPLGLGDFVHECSGQLHDHSADVKEGETKMSLARKYPCSDKRFLLPKIPENERIKRLKSQDAFREKEGVIECEMTRESRASNFCQCKVLTEDGNCCQDETCSCVAAGINCHIEGPRCCSCSMSIRTSFSSVSSISIHLPTTSFSDLSASPPSSSPSSSPSSLSSSQSSSASSSQFSSISSSPSSSISSSPSSSPSLFSSSCLSNSSPATSYRISGCMNPYGRYIFNETEAKRRRLSLLGKIIVTTPKNSPLQEMEIVKVNLNDFFQERGGVLM